MLAIKLAYRNLIGAGFRTWLNVFILSFSFLVIIWHRGINNGWDRQARTDTINQEIGGGQYWHENYDPYDPFTLTESHGVIPGKLQSNDNCNKVVGIDGSIEMITKAKQKGGEFHLAKLPGWNPSQKFDLIHSMEFLYYLKDCYSLRII